MTMLLEFLERHRARHLFRSSHLNGSSHGCCLLSPQSPLNIVPTCRCWVTQIHKELLWAVCDVTNISAFPFLLLDVVGNDVSFNFFLNNSS